MSDWPAFDQNGIRTGVVLPFDLHPTIDAWSSVQRSMTRERPDAFTRDEWAYLVAFTGADNLLSVFKSVFGVPATGPIDRLARPRGGIAIWLPNNVSLLGPLTIILASLTGNAIRVKAGSRADDLATAFVRYVRGTNQKTLNAVLDQISIEQFGREDERNASMAASARVRIVFGSDVAASAIDRLPHPIDSVAFHFSDRASEVWLDRTRLNDETLRTLIRTFAIYGQAGCTSPRKVVIIDGSSDDPARLADRLASMWPEVVRRDVDIHVASQNVMAAQWAAVSGWTTRLTARNAAVVASGTPDLAPIDSFLTLPVVSASLNDAARALPRNIQTLGHEAAEIDAWLPRLAATAVKRIVPIRAMHHFGALWDGWEWWRQSFEIVEVRR
jgi:hypothetical protein